MRVVNRFTLSLGPLGRKMVGGAFWTAGSFVYIYAVRFLSTVIVTRLLVPEAYGLMSLGMLVVTGLALFSDIGLAPSVIRSTRGDESDFLRTAWSLQILRGLFIGLMGCLIAWPVAYLYDEPQLVLLICALSLIPVIDGVKSISQLVCTRHVQLLGLSLIEMAAATSSMVLTVFFAWYLGSVWALVIGTLVGGLVQLVFGYIFLPPFKHYFSMNRTDVMEILTFGGWILLSTLVTFVGGRGLMLIQGALVPIDVLGFLVLADTIAGAMFGLVSTILVKVYFPAMSDVFRNRPHELRTKVRRVQTIVYAGLIPLFIGLSLVAYPLVDVVYDDRYAMVGGFLAIMAISYGFDAMFLSYTQVILTKGGGRTHFKLMAVLTTLRVTGAIAGFHIAGVFGMVAGGSLAFCIYHLYLLRAAFKAGIGSPIRDLVMLATMTLVLLAVSAQVIAQAS